MLAGSKHALRIGLVYVSSTLKSILLKLLGPQAGQDFSLFRSCESCRLI